MKEIIPFKKDILFKTKINEITDISLEHDYKILDDLVEGDFIIEGSYKMTQASVIKEDFFYKVPFTIAISDKIKKETIDLNIRDFSYDIKNDDTLNINVELSLSCEEKDELDNVIEEVLESDSVDIEEETREEEIEQKKEEIIEIEEEKVEIPKPEIKQIEEEVLEEPQEVIEEQVVEEKEVQEEEIKNVIDSVKEKNDYVTYKVYIAKENDTIESISLKYNTEVSELRKYNNNEIINVGDKIIIPYIINE